MGMRRYRPRPKLFAAKIHRLARPWLSVFDLDDDLDEALACVGGGPDEPKELGSASSPGK